MEISRDGVPRLIDTSVPPVGAALWDIHTERERETSGSKEKGERLQRDGEREREHTPLVVSERVRELVRVLPATDGIKPNHAHTTLL